MFTWLGVRYEVSYLYVSFPVLMVSSHKERNENKLHAICQTAKAVARWFSVRKVFLKGKFQIS